MATNELMYDGVKIQARGEMLSLTDMWRAAKASDSQRPANWLQLESTQRLIREVLSDVGISYDEAIQSLRGNDAGTWAHWLIGMSYAKYLSPAFHVWCNKVVKAYMEGKFYEAPEPQPQEDPPELRYMLGEIEAHELPPHLAHFAGLSQATQDVFAVGKVLGFSKLDCVIASMLLVKSESPIIEGTCKRESKDVTTLNGDAMLSNAELAKRLGIKAASSDGSSITHLLYRAGLITKPRGRTLTPLGSRYGRIANQDGGTHLRWTDPDTANYLIKWSKKNAR